MKGGRVRKPARDQTRPQSNYYDKTVGGIVVWPSGAGTIGGITGGAAAVGIGSTGAPGIGIMGAGTGVDMSGICSAKGDEVSSPIGIGADGA